MILWLRKIL